MQAYLAADVFAMIGYRLDAQMQRFGNLFTCFSFTHES
jgi:hypothetical protein